jgi:hypothetical protein
MLESALLISQEEKHVHAPETASSPEAPRGARFRCGSGGGSPAEEETWRSDSSGLQQLGAGDPASACIRFVH